MSEEIERASSFLSIGITPHEDGVILDRPIPVEIHSPVSKVEKTAPDFGSAGQMAVPVAGTAEPVQLLSRAPNRDIAYIYVGAMAGNTLLVNSNRAALTASIPQGAAITGTGQEIKWRSQQPLYGICLGGVIIANILDNLWASGE